MVVVRWAPWFRSLCAGPHLHAPGLPGHGVSTVLAAEEGGWLARGTVGSAEGSTGRWL